jgi:hypothetical protein
MPDGTVRSERFPDGRWSPYVARAGSTAARCALNDAIYREYCSRCTLSSKQMLLAGGIALLTYSPSREPP